jgi:PTH1 family peptidyl-tRNA hydrolase
MVIDRLGSIEANVEVLKPDTFMNLSGEAVSKISKYHKIPSENIWVIHDDLDLEFGTLRVRQGGSSGGHNGIKSISQYLGSDNFWRFRVGIGHNEDVPSEVYVLDKFSKEEGKILPRLIDQVGQIVLDSLGKRKISESTYQLI